MDRYICKIMKKCQFIYMIGNGFQINGHHNIYHPGQANLEQRTMDGSIGEEENKKGGNEGVAMVRL